MQVFHLHPQGAVHDHQAFRAHIQRMTSAIRDTSRRPRYLQVRERLVERIQSGAWAPGQPIPSEFDIAHEFGVSQGTARMAVAALASENIVVRRQGLGTFVYEHTPGDDLMRFSRLFDTRHQRIDPGAQSGRPVRTAANRRECRELKLAAGSDVLRVARVRLRDGKPFVLERISLPALLFPDLASREKVPAALYELYQKSYGVHVVRAEERLSAVAADRRAAKALGIGVGTPLLRIERIATALVDKPVEWRVSLCYLGDAHYLTRLE
jgi:GntR family transcriptional regulator